MKPRSKRNRVKKEEENSTAVHEAGQNSTRDLKSEKIVEKEIVEEAMVKSEPSDQENESSALAGKSKTKDEENESKESTKTKEVKPKIANKKSEKGEKSNSRDTKCEKGENSNSNSSSDNDSIEKSDDETDDEEEIEDDVKVCDICGDVGEEDKLATCTKCSDGAEHIYCMRVFMKKLPEGEWLCEECQIEAEKQKLLQKKGKQKAVSRVTEKQNAEEFEYMMDQEDEFLAIELLKKESKSKAPRSLNSYSKKRDQEESLKNLESENPDLESGVLKKPESEILKKPVSEIPKKPESEIPKKVESEIPKKPESEIPKKVESGELKKKGTLQIREKVNNSDLEKGKLGTSVSKLPVPPPRGNLSKSSSFKSAFPKEPKVKQITEVPQNPKIAKEPPVSSNNNIKKEGPDQKIITKSTSFKKPPMKPSSKSSDFKDPKEKNPTNNSLNNNNNNNNSNNNNNINNNNNNNNNNNKSGSILGRPSSIGLLSTPKLDSSTQAPDNLGRTETKKPVLPKPDDISTCPLLDSILNRSATPVQSRAPRCQRCNESGHSIQSCPKNPSLVINKGNNASERVNSVKEGVLVKRPRAVVEQKELGSEGGKICRFAPAVLEKLRSAVIPQLDFVWQGGFELVKEGRPSDIFEGFQAHFSSSASPKLQNLLCKGLPCKVPFQEVPRQQMWPAQFVQGGPTESHIALYFFPKDQESYENCYVKLVESMRKNDVALRGRIDSIELLVFPSTLLPEYSQRWNRLFYLWGVFKGKSANLSKYENNFNGRSANLSKVETNLKGESANLSKDETNSKGESANLCENMETEQQKEKEIRVLDVNKDEFQDRTIDETLIETRPNRKRFNSTGPLSDPESCNLNGEKEHKKAKVDLNGDLHLDERMESTGSCSSKTEKEEKFLQTTVIQNTESNTTGFDLEKLPPDFELALGDVEISPYTENNSSNNNNKGENNDNNRINVSESVRVNDESASSLSLSLALAEDSNREKPEKNVVSFERFKDL